MVPAHRKTRRYLSALLARHETGRPAPGQHLWTRLRPGQYLLNPMLAIEAAPGTWHTAHRLLYTQIYHPQDPLWLIDKVITREYARILEDFVEAVRKRREELTE